MSITPTSRDKDPDAILDYVWDWSEWLPSGDTINSFDVTVSDAENSLTITTTNNTSTTVTVWLSGGVVGTAPTCTVGIVSTDGREDERTLTLNIRQR